MTHTKETAAAVFERINRHRAQVAAPRGVGGGQEPASPGETIVEPPLRAQVDEVLFQPASSRSRNREAAGASPRAGPEGVADPLADRVADPLADPAADRFPRSATMRLILKHPALALGIGVPAAGLLLKSPASRRLLGMAVRVGTGPELQTLFRLSTTAGREQTPR